MPVADSRMFCTRFCSPFTAVDALPPWCIEYHLSNRPSSGDWAATMYVKWNDNFLVCVSLILMANPALDSATAIFTQRHPTFIPAGARLVGQGWSNKRGTIDVSGRLCAEIRPSVRGRLYPAQFPEHEPHSPYSEEGPRLGGHDPSSQGRSLQIAHLVPIGRSNGITSRDRRNDPAPPS